MKKLPIGIQTLSEINGGDYIYVDKTKLIAELIEGKYYFLSRPRRFGKSLLVDTLKQIFLGNKELFKGLWIENQIDWQPYPVIHIDFNQVSYKDQGLREGLKNMVAQVAGEHQITLASSDLKEQFIQLIKDLYAAYRQPVVMLIDEYDKPIIDYLDNIPQAVENREILKTFYSPVKPLDPYLKFVLITGVSKFSHVSIFSDLNNLNDITTHPRYAQMLGITWEEIETNFSEYLEELHKDYGDETRALIKHWYDGYSWDGRHFVYNPFSVLNLFDKYKFANYWFRTGTPTFLTKLVKTGNFNVPEFEQLVTTSSVLDKFEIENIELAGILFQTGYLTIKKKEGEYYILGYPNHEVRQSWFEHLLSMLNEARLQSNN